MSFLNYLDEYKEILKNLIAFNTISSTNADEDMSNKDLLDYVESFYKKFNFHTIRYKVTDKKENLYVSSKLSDGGLLLSGHTDTVPCNKALWQTDPFVLEHIDNKLVGLGTTDMKGYLALIMLFMSKLDKDSLKKPISALFSCDEETDMKGAIDYLAKATYRPDLILIGESTENKAVIAHKGYMSLQLDIEGKSAHSSNPDLGINAIDGAMLFVNTLNKYKESLKKEVDTRFAVPYTTLNIGVIDGGFRSNIVCPHVKMLLDLRVLPSYTSDMAFDDLNNLVLNLNKESLCKFSLKKSYAHIEPFECSDKATIDLLEDVIGDKSLCVNYSTEGAFLSKLAPLAILGPGSIKYAHSIDECIYIDELEKAFIILDTLSKKIL